MARYLKVFLFAILVSLPGLAQADSCSYLKEQVEIFLTLQDAVSEDFDKVTDTELCETMVEQCEHFYEQASEYKKVYAKRCDAYYENIQVTACDFEFNVCRKKTKKAYQDGLHASQKRTKWEYKEKYVGEADLKEYVVDYDDFD